MIVGAIFIGILSLLFIVVVMVVISELSDSDLFKVGQASRRLRKKNRELVEENKRLLETIALLDQKNVSLTTELIARRNQLPWVNVEELDGTQE